MASSLRTPDSPPKLGRNPSYIHFTPRRAMASRHSCRSTAIAVSSPQARRRYKHPAPGLTAALPPQRASRAGPAAEESGAETSSSGLPSAAKPRRHSVQAATSISAAASM